MGQPIASRIHRAHGSATSCSPLSQHITFFWGCSSFQHRSQVHATTHSKLHPLPLDTPIISLGTSANSEAPQWHYSHSMQDMLGRSQVLHHLEPLGKNVNPERLGILLLSALSMFSSLFTAVALKMGAALALCRQWHQQQRHCLASAK